MGDEARGMVVVDFDGHPQKFDQMEILSQFVAKEVNVLKVDVPRAGGKGWKRTNSEIETQDTDLGNSWCEEVSTGAKYVLEETWVKANDPHYDAKVFFSTKRAAIRRSRDHFVQGHKRHCLHMSESFTK